MNHAKAVRVVAALIRHGDRLLVCQRRGDGSFPLKWEFPGGKVEGKENDFTALQRELREELGIELRSATEIFRHRHLYPDQLQVELTFFQVKAYQGKATNRAFHRLLWVKVQELERLDFLEGDLALIEKLTRQELHP